MSHMTASAACMGDGLLLSVYDDGAYVRREPVGGDDGGHGNEGDAQLDAL